MLAATCTAAQAKIFGVGVKAGLEVPSISTEDVVGTANDASTGFHVGLLAMLNIPVIGLGVQPEVLYVNRGVTLSETTERVSYIDVPLNITWGIDVMLVRPFIAVTPFISYCLNDVKATYMDAASALSTTATLDKLDYGIGVGAGIDILGTLQVMGRYNWGLNDLGGGKAFSYKMSSFTLSLGYLF